MPSPAVGEFELVDESATARLGAAVAGGLRVGEAVCLSGPLGAGKSSLARGLIRALAGQGEEVPSPTFTLVQTYPTPHLAVAHFDLYRLTRFEEIDELGLDDALDLGAAVIEWPERLEGRLPRDRLDIVLRPIRRGAAEGRQASLRPHGRWEGRLIEL